MDFCVYISLFSVVDNTITLFNCFFVISVVSVISVISEFSIWPPYESHKKIIRKMFNVSMKLVIHTFFKDLILRIK